MFYSAVSKVDVSCSADAYHKWTLGFVGIKFIY